MQGPYKQYMGRSKNTGNITVVLYEDPPDGIPKIHIRSSKYMAWIAEQGMPVHMHVEKVRNRKHVFGMLGVLMEKVRGDKRMEDEGMAIVCLYIEKNVRMRWVARCVPSCCGLTGPDGMSN